MYSYIKGIFVGQSGNSIVIDNGGIGYNINYPITSYGLPFSYGDEVKIYTHFQVTENAMSLYGFISEDDRDVFRRLISVNGVGPKAALGILSTLSADDLRFAVLGNDSKLISTAPGIGKKTAEKIILELKDKFTLEDTFETALTNKSAGNAAGVSAGVRNDAIAGLTSLGFSSSEAIRALGKIDIGPDSTVEEVLGLALEHLSNI